MKLTISGIGWVTPAGIGSGLAGEIFEQGCGPLPSMKSRRFLDESHPRFGRFDSYAKAGFGAISLALRSAGLYKWQQKRDIGLVVSTRNGCLEADLAYFQTVALDGGALASPNLFTYTVPNCMLGEASIHFGLTGPCLVIDDSEDHLAGVIGGAWLIRSGLCQTIAAGWCNIHTKDRNFNKDNASGAIFFLLKKGLDSSPLQCDGRNLTYEKERVADIAHLVRIVLKTRLSNGAVSK